MDFLKEDPGAVQYGNFINYYQFNSAEERLCLLPKHVWNPNENNLNNSSHDDEPYLVLDVGCNAGDFTQLLQKFLVECNPNKRPVHILGVDIDERLIERAVQMNQLPQFVAYKQLDVMNDDHFKELEVYLKQFNRTAFDAICCFSITMWIHLNHHDAGLQKFLKKLCELAALFVVEPQPWKCYQTAERRLKKAGEMFTLFSALKWRSDVDTQLQNYIEHDLRRIKIYETSPTKWKRKIYFYR